MRRRAATAMTLGLVAMSAVVSAQPAPAGPGQAPEGRGAAVRRPPPVRPPLFLREEWKQPPYTGRLTEPARHLTQEAVTNPNLELRVYGPCKDSMPGLQVYG